MKNIHQKLFEIQKEKLTFKKTADNPFFHSKYLPLEELIEGLLPILEKYKLLITHSTHEKYVVTSVIDVESGELVSSAFPLQEGLEPQKVGSAITYAKRYNIGQIFNIITDEDDDGNASVTLKNDRSGVIKPKMTQDTASSFGTMFCPVCKVDAVISKKTGKPYCPNFKNHPKDQYIKLIPKPTENEIDFGKSLDEDIDRLNMGI